MTALSSGNAVVYTGAPQDHENTVNSASTNHVFWNPSCLGWALEPECRILCFVIILAMVVIISDIVSILVIM